MLSTRMPKVYQTRHFNAVDARNMILEYRESGVLRARIIDFKDESMIQEMESIIRDVMEGRQEEILRTTFVYPQPKESLFGWRTAGSMELRLHGDENRGAGADGSFATV